MSSCVYFASFLKISYFVERVLEAVQLILSRPCIVGLVVVDDLPFKDLGGAFEDLVELAQLLVVVHDVLLDQVDGLQPPVHLLAELIEEVGGLVACLLLHLLIEDRRVRGRSHLGVAWRIGHCNMSRWIKALLFPWRGTRLLHFYTLHVEVVRGGAE